MIGPYQVLPFRARMNLGAMAMTEYIHHPKLKHYRNLAIRLFSVISGHSLGEPYPFSQIQSVNSTAPADWASDLLMCIYVSFINIFEWTLVSNSYLLYILPVIQSELSRRHWSPNNGWSSPVSYFRSRIWATLSSAVIWKIPILNWIYFTKSLFWVHCNHYHYYHP